jgi:simple sugar transport system ATP-binding protein
MLCGLYQPDSGYLLRNGKPMHLSSPRAGLHHGIAMVHQHFRLVDRFTVSENVILGSRDLSFRLHRKEINEQVAAVAESFGLPIEPDAVVGELSVGQRQRVEIVKALYQGAEILLLDEPTAGLDLNCRKLVAELIAAERTRGVTVVMATHELADAEQATAVMLLAQRVVSMGPPQEALRDEYLRECFGFTQPH